MAACGEVATEAQALLLDGSWVLVYPKRYPGSEAFVCFKLVSSREGVGSVRMRCASAEAAERWVAALSVLLPLEEE